MSNWYKQSQEFSDENLGGHPSDPQKSRQFRGAIWFDLAIPDSGDLEYDRSRADAILNDSATDISHPLIMNWYTDPPKLYPDELDI